LKKENEEGTRLNKYIANTGLCNRRKADEYILGGKIKVNGIAVTEMGFKIQPDDEVAFNDRIISAKQKSIYLLINKPQNFTAFKSTQKNIWQLISEFNSKKLKILHPLKESSCGLLFVTSDSSVIEKLSEIPTKKLYYLQLEAPITKKELQQIKTGADKEGLKVQNINFVQDKPNSHIGIELYDKTDDTFLQLLKKLNIKCIKLDRVVYGNFTKKDLPRGRWRHLTEKEIITLKHF